MGCRSSPRTTSCQYGCYSQRGCPCSDGARVFLTREGSGCSSIAPFLHSSEEGATVAAHCQCSTLYLFGFVCRTPDEETDRLPGSLLESVASMLFLSEWTTARGGLCQSPQGYYVISDTLCYSPLRRVLPDKLLVCRPSGLPTCTNAFSSADSLTNRGRPSR